MLSQTATKYGAWSGYLRVYQLNDGNAQLVQLQFFVVRNAVAYTLTFTHRRERLEAARKLAEQMFAQLRLDETWTAGAVTCRWRMRPIRPSPTFLPTNAPMAPPSVMPGYPATAWPTNAPTMMNAGTIGL